jgi:hypothetical protein
MSPISQVGGISSVLFLRKDFMYFCVLVSGLMNESVNESWMLPSHDGLKYLNFVFTGDNGGLSLHAAVSSVLRDCGNVVTSPPNPYITEVSDGITPLELAPQTTVCAPFLLKQRRWDGGEVSVCVSM